PAHARAARAALARQAHGAEAAKLHLAAAADAMRELDWRTLDAELDAALKAAGDDAGERDEVAKVILDDATELQSTVQTSRDRAVGNEAKALYARYLALPGHAEGQPRDLAKKLDETMAVDDPKGRGPHTVVEGTLDKATLRKL